MSFPNLPGVPPLRGNSGIAAVATLAAPGINLLLSALKPKWLILKSDGITKALSPDSVLGIEYKNEHNVSNFPVEQGAFSSYNKVRTPFNAIIKVTKGSSINTLLGNTSTSSTLSTRKDFLATLEAMVGDTNFYIIVTPEATYTNCNLVNYDYRREVGNGANIIIANLHFMQIVNAQLLKTPPPAFSVAPTPSFSPPSVQPPWATGQVSGGAYQPLTPGVH